MRRLLSIAACASILCAPLASSAAVYGDLSLPDGLSDLMPKGYIVTLKNDADVDGIVAKVLSRNGVMADHVYNSALKGFSITLPPAVMDLLKKDPNVVSVEEDKIVHIEAITVKNTQKLPTGIDRVNGEAKVNKGTGVEVAVIDTGIDTTSSTVDLQGKVIGGKNCAGGFSNPPYKDGNGHGTHVSGIIAAQDNTVGVVGMAPGVKLWAVRVLDNGGYGTWSGIICGVDFVTANASHIKVANMSLGGDGNDGPSAFHTAIQNSVAAGVTYVVAAGNESDDVKNHVPAAFDEVIAVSALADSNGKACGGGSNTSYGADDTYATFSNYATLASDVSRMIGAPGVSIESTWRIGTYKVVSGTSMASPHVTGAAALYIATHPGSTPAQVRDALIAAGEPQAVNFKNECASGVSHQAGASGRTYGPVLRADSL